MFVAACGELTATLKDVVWLTILSIFGETKAMGDLKGEDEQKLCYLTSAMTSVRSFGKSTYATWLGFFINGEGSWSRCLVKAFLD